MAKKKYSPNSISSLNEDWGLDAKDSEQRPFSGQAVQDFIKGQFNTKVGYVAYDKDSNRYMLFASEDTYNEYKTDSDKTELVIGSFEAPYNYEARITLETLTYNSIFLGTTGNYLDFSFDITNKSGQSTGENVTCTYTFVNGNKQTTLNAIYKANEYVHLNIDDYLEEGTNRIKVSITGADTLASTAVSVTYLMVNLTLEDEFDISKVIDLTSSNQTLEIPYTISGYGTKELEWYIDGELQPNVKDEDEVVETTTSRTKYITVAGLSQGTHTLQFRAYLMSEGNKFYSNTYYREFMVYTGESKDAMVALSCEIPNTEELVTADNPLQLYGITQYASYSLEFATYSPKQAATTTVTVKLDDTALGSVDSKNDVVNTYTIQPTTSGNKTVSLALPDMQRDVPAYVSKATISVAEITAGLSFAFDATGKTNNASDKDSWTYGSYTATFAGFDWNNTSGWVDNALRIAAGNQLSIDCAPLSTDGMNTGKTMEFSFKSLAVKDDDAVICDLTANNVGLKITASEVKLLSSGGKTISTKYKSGEDVRVSIVLNRHTGSTNKGLVFIYVDGIISAAINVMSAENFVSKATLSFKGTEDAEIALRQMRFYDSALTSDQILNNFILYQQDAESMTTAYNRNDIYEEGSTTFSTDKMVNRCPVMIVTGDIPTLENTSNKNEQITVDIEYTNMQDPTKNFKMVGAAMRPQGTSSMSYPKKNFRIYTKRLSNTVLYDASGNEVEDKLYSFKDGAQPVSTWCLKADYAESSGTHNTGIARLWNDVMYNARIDGEYKLRTNAQKAALENKYNYDVRTTVDGFPILLFYRLTEADDLVFIGKYNFNNDKSTEKVFGFCDIPGFDNTNMECWEVLNNGDSIALFQTVDDFDNKYTDAFESRYPDGSTEHTNLKAFCEWIVGVKNNAAKFATEKWDHLDVYKVAAYYIYLMRFGAVDQTVKNAMFTTEDGKLWYYINYDNDTINGVINTGELAADYDITRQSKGSDGQYVYAGHESVLWNLLEADTEFMDIVRTVDQALYVAGLKYSTVIDMFNNKQAGKWSERVYNQDAQYKYITPYTSSGTNNLFMLQGSRSSHRKYWLSRRFDLYDSLYISGEFKNKVLEFKLTNDTPAGQQFSITAGMAMYYGYGINDIPTETGISLKKGESHEFTTPRVLNLGDPVRIYSANNIKKLDISKLIDRINQLTFSTGGEELECLEELTVGSSEKSNSWLSEISGLKLATKLKKLDITNCSGFTGIDLSGLEKMETLNAYGTSLTSVIFEKGSNVSSIKFPATMQAIALEQLPKLSVSGFSISSWANVYSIKITGCPNLSNDISFVTNWYANKTVANENCSLEMDGVNWTDVNPQTLLKLGEIKTAGGTLKLKGKIALTAADTDTISSIKEIFGDNVFDSSSELWITAPDAVFIIGPDTLLAGEDGKFEAIAVSQKEGTVSLSLSGNYLYGKLDSETGILHTYPKSETTWSSDSTIAVTVKASFTSTDQTVGFTTEKIVNVYTRRYPTALSISGEPTLNGENTFKSVFTYKSSDWEGNTPGDIVWTLSDELVAAGTTISKQSNEGCTVRLDSITDNVDGTLTAVMTTYSYVGKSDSYYSKSTITATFDLYIINPSIAVSAKTNPNFMAALYSAGLCANEGYMTKAEAAQVTDTQWSTFQCSSQLTRFDEITNFTNITYFSTAVMSSSYKLRVKDTEHDIVMPENIVRWYKFYTGEFTFKRLIVNSKCLSLGPVTADEIVIPEDGKCYSISCDESKLIDIRATTNPDYTSYDKPDVEGTNVLHIVGSSEYKNEHKLKMVTQDTYIYPGYITCFSDFDTPNTVTYNGIKFHIVNGLICLVANSPIRSDFSDAIFLHIPPQATGILYAAMGWTYKLYASEINKLTKFYGSPFYWARFYSDDGTSYGDLSLDLDKVEFKDSSSAYLYGKDKQKVYYSKVFEDCYCRSIILSSTEEVNFELPKINIYNKGDGTTTVDLKNIGYVINYNGKEIERLILRGTSSPISELDTFGYYQYIYYEYLSRIDIYNLDIVPKLFYSYFGGTNSTSATVGTSVDSSVAKTVHVPADTTIADDSLLKTQLVDINGFTIVYDL